MNAIHRPFRVILRRMLTELQPQRGLMMRVITVCVLQQVLQVVASALGAIAIGLAFAAAGVSLIWAVIGGLLAAVIARGVFHYLEMWLAHELAYRGLQDIRIHLYRALARLDLGTLQGLRSGELVATAMSDVEVIENFYAHTIGPFVAAMLIIVASVIGFFLVHPVLMLTVGPFMIAAVMVPVWFAQRAADQGRMARQLGGLHAAELTDTVQGLKELSVFGALDRRVALHRRREDELGKAQGTYARRAASEAAALDGLSALGAAAGLVSGGILVGAGDLPIAAYPAIVLVSTMVFRPIADLVGIATNMGTIRAAAERVFAVLDWKPTITDPATPAQPPDGPVGITFENVTFRYPSRSRPALDAVTLSIPAGQTVAIVGPSGAGKTTLANLVLRAFDPDEGRIGIGSVDLRDLADTDVRRLVHIVQQDVYLFPGTVAENIALGAKGEIDHAQLCRAVEAAQASAFIEELPGGLDTILDERGSNLSGGQRQRLAIARALYGDAKILVLDEAAANLDAENERLVQAALGDLRPGKTLILVAHRLSTMQFADRIVMLKEGRIVADGSFNTLVKQPGPFRTLVEPGLQELSVLRTLRQTAKIEPATTVRSLP